MARNPSLIRFWRGRLPHWEVEEGKYFVTIHLAGAIPPGGQERIRALSAEGDDLSREDTDKMLRVQRRVYAEMEKWLDRVGPITHLHTPSVAQSVSEAIQHRHGRQWHVIEYVIMPSHLHLFFQLLDADLQSSLEQFKRWTGHQAAKLLQLQRGRFWQDEWFDHWSRSDEEDEKIVHYIRQNPVKAKLVERYTDWPFGSWAATIKGEA